MRMLNLKSSVPPEIYPVGTGLTIGRDEGNAIRLNQKQVEPQHARITVIGPHVFIEDLETTSGTTVNGRKITRWALKKGDELQIGLTVLVYDEDDKPEPSKKVPASVPPPPPAVSTGNGTNKPQKSPALTETQILPKNKSKDAPQPFIPKSSDRPPAIRTPPASSSGRQPVPPSGKQSPARASNAKIVPATGVPNKGPGASARFPSASQRLKAEGQSISIRTKAVLEASIAASQSLRKPAVEQIKPSKMTIGGIVGMCALIVLFVVFLIFSPYFRRVLEKRRAAAEIQQRKDDALTALKKSPRDPRDLRLMLNLVQGKKDWSEIKAVLGDPDQDLNGQIELWDPYKGVYRFQATEIRGFYFASDINPDASPETFPACAMALFIRDERIIECKGIVYFAFDPNAEKLKAPPPPPPLVLDQPPPAAEETNFDRGAAEQTDEKSQEQGPSSQEF